MASSNNIIITFSIAILLLLILLLLVSYNSKCKTNNSEKFSENNTGYSGYYSQLSNNKIDQPEYSENKSIADISNKNQKNFDMPSSGLGGNIEPSLGFNDDLQPVESNKDRYSNNSPVDGNIDSSVSKDRLTSNDLLPVDPNSNWAQLNPAGSGDLRDINFLTAGHHLGINTTGSSLRNANLQLRSEVPNPQVPVSPWMISTIEPDVRRAPLEIGTTA